MTDTPRALRYAPHAAVGSVGYAMFAYSAVPNAVMGRLGIDFASFGLLMSAALASFVLVQPVAGRLVAGRETAPVLLAATAAHGGVAVALELAGSFELLVALRLCWGAAAGLVLSVGATQVSRVAHGANATFQQGVYGGMVTLGGTVGFLLAPELVATTGGVGLYGGGAVLAVPAVALLWPYRSAGRTAPAAPATAEEASTIAVATDRTVALASLCYVAIIGSYITISTFVTAYFDDLGVGGAVNAAVLLVATVGRAGGGLLVRRGAVEDTRLIGGASVLAATGLAGLALGPRAALVAALPIVVMLAVSIPFGAVYDVAAAATPHEGAALATVIAVGNVAALILPAVTGALRDATGEYRSGFALLAVLNLVAVAAATGLGARTDGGTDQQ